MRRYLATPGNICSTLLLASTLGAGAQETTPSPPGDASGEQTATFSERIEATAITVTVEIRDASGAVPATLAVEDFEVLEDGVSRTVLSIERAGATAPPALPVGTEVRPDAPSEIRAGEHPVSIGSAATLAPVAVPAAPGPGGEPWQLVLYFDAPTAALPTFRDASRVLAARAGELVALGSVELVVAEPSPHRVAGPTRDAARLAAELERLAGTGGGSNEIAQMRREFVAATDADGTENLLGPTRPSGRGGGSPAPGAGTQGILYRNQGTRSDDAGVRAGVSGQRRQMLIRSTAAREFQLLARQRALLLDWLARVERPRRPRAVVLVTDGFDLDPTEFYLSFLRDSTLVSSTRSDLEGLHSGEPFERMAQTLAAAGWQVIPVSLGQPGAQSAAAADASGRGRYRSFITDKRPQSTESGLVGFLLRAPIDPLRTIAEETGGDLALSPAQLEAGIRALGDRFRLTYQVPRAPDGATHALAVRARPAGWRVRAPRAVSGATPDAMMAARARHALATGVAEGASLEIEASARRHDDPAQSQTEVWMLSYDVDLTSLLGEIAALDAGDLRITLAVELPDGRVLIGRSRPTPRDLSSDFHYVAREPLRVPKGTARLAVAVDDLTTGTWVAARVVPEG